MFRTLTISAALAVLVAACGSTVQVAAPGAVPGSPGAVAPSASTDSEFGLALVPTDPTRGASEAGAPTFAAGGTDGGGTTPTGSTSGGTTAPTTGGTTGTTTGGTTTGGGTATSTGGSGGGAPPANDEPLRVGIIVPEGDAGGGLGVSLQFEDYPRIAEAVVASINDEGGMAGRAIEPVIREASQDDQSESAQTQQAEAICASLTQDTTVDLVIADGTTGTQYAFDCYAAARTPVLVPSSLVDDEQMARLRPWLLPYPIHTTDRVARELPRVLASQGVLSDKIGILAFDTPDGRRIVEQVLEPEIARHGGTVVETVWMQVTYQDVGAQTSSAVLRFKAQGIDFVIPGFASGGAVTGIFMHEAESQSYRPTYGLSSLDVPVAVDDTLGAPPAQMANSVGMGYLPAFDVPQGQYPVTPREQECWDVVNERLGTSYSDRSPTAGNGFAAIQLCELFWLVDAALDPTAGQAFDPARVIDHIEALGEYASVQLPVARFAPGRPDGAAVQRVFGFDASGCSCFTYTSDWMPVR